MYSKSVRRFLSDAQVAGHAGSFIPENDKLLKILQLNERTFYDKVNQESASTDLKNLRKFIPGYYGTVIRNEVFSI